MGDRDFCSGHIMECLREHDSEIYSLHSSDDKSYVPCNSNHESDASRNDRSNENVTLDDFLEEA